MSLLFPGPGFTSHRQLADGVTQVWSMGPVAVGYVFESMRVTVQAPATVGGAFLDFGAAVGLSAVGGVAALRAGRQLIDSSDLVVETIPLVEMNFVAQGFWWHEFPVGVGADAGPLWLIVQAKNSGATTPMSFTVSMRTARVRREFGGARGSGEGVS
mgnify:CR=1 FL=1